MAWNTILAFNNRHFDPPKILILFFSDPRTLFFIPFVALLSCKLPLTLFLIVCTCIFYAKSYTQLFSYLLFNIKLYNTYTPQLVFSSSTEAH